MMEAVKRGGDRQVLHEKIRQHSMAATARMKEGEPCDLLDRLASNHRFRHDPCGVGRRNGALSLNIGRCRQQVERFLAECAPLLTNVKAADDRAIGI